MKIEEIKHPELKNHINMIYMHSENQNQEAIDKTEAEIKEYVNDKYFIISVEDEKPVKIPYANDGEYIVPIFTDEQEYVEKILRDLESDGLLLQRAAFGFLKKDTIGGQRFTKLGLDFFNFITL